MLHKIRSAYRRSDPMVGDLAGCVALTVMLIAGLHLPFL